MNRREDLVWRFEDFQYFMLSDAGRKKEHRSAIGKKLTAFARALGGSSPMASVREQFYGTSSTEDFVRPGKLRKEAFSYWVSFGPKVTRSNCHFTLRMTEDGLALEAFSPFKTWTGYLIEKASRKPHDFVSALRKVKRTTDPYHFRLREAYYCDPDNSRKGECISHRVDYLTVHPSILDAKNVFTLVIEPTRARLKERNFRPEIFFVRHFPLSEVLDRNDVIENVASAVEPMMPYFSFAFDS